jgi:hypothetical protein
MVAEFIAVIRHRIKLNTIFQNYNKPHHGAEIHRIALEFRVLGKRKSEPV